MHVCVCECVFAVPIYFYFFPLAFVLVNDLFSGFLLCSFWKCIFFAFVAVSFHFMHLYFMFTAVSYQKFFYVPPLGFLK